MPDEEVKILLPSGVEHPSKKVENCPKCGVSKEEFRKAFGGVVWCIQCGEEIKNG